MATSSFDFRQLTSVTNYHRASEGVTVAGASGLATTWNDISAGGNNVAQATAANQPAWTPGANPSLSFDTNNFHQFSNATSAYATPLTGLSAFTVIDPTHSNANNVILSFGALNGIVLIYNSPAGTNGVSYAQEQLGFDDRGMTSGQNRQVNIKMPMGPTLFGFTYVSGQTIKFYINKDVYTLSFVATVGAALTGLSIGSYVNGSFPFAGDIWETCTANSVATQANVNDMLAYMNAVYPTFNAYPNYSVTFMGDSISCGFKCNRLRSAWNNKYTLGLGKDVVQYNMSISGRTLASIAAFETTTYNSVYYDSTLKGNIVVVFAGTNDIAAAQSSSIGGLTPQVLIPETGAGPLATSLKTTCASVRATGAKAVVASVLPRKNTFTNGQTGAGFEADRIAYNTWLRSNWSSFADGFMDVGGDPVIGVTSALTNTQLYNGDLVHPSDLGHDIISKYARAAIAFVANKIAGGNSGVGGNALQSLGTGMPIIGTM